MQKVTMDYSRCIGRTKEGVEADLGRKMSNEDAFKHICSMFGRAFKTEPRVTGQYTLEVTMTELDKLNMESRRFTAEQFLAKARADGVIVKINEQ